jgi:hypothetical protein
MPPEASVRRPMIQPVHAAGGLGPPADDPAGAVAEQGDRRRGPA